MQRTWKPSNYNVVVGAGDAHPGMSILYNTSTGALALIDEAMQAALDDANEGGEAAQALYDAGFLIDASTDELALAKAAYINAQQDSSLLSMLIAPTYSCNLKCPYCYESGHDSKDILMSETVQDQIIAFIEQIYQEKPFARFDIQWYGGEPLLGIKVIERLSKRLIHFCEEHGIAYSPMMISNGTLIGEDEARILKEAQLKFALVTVDGPKRMHNVRRPERDGSDSYEAAMRGIGNLLAQGITVNVVMNTDQLNYDALDELNEDLVARFGISANRTLLNDYYRTYGSGDFCQPTFDLMGHKEFALRQCDQFCSEPHSSSETASLLAPAEFFCRGQRENYFAIDAQGDVYKCDGRMGRPEYALFNLSDADTYTGNTAPEYPFNNAACVKCQLLPICKGTCEWERMSCADHPCHPLKHTMSDYLQKWVDSIDDIPASVDGLAILYKR